MAEDPDELDNLYNDPNYAETRVMMKTVMQDAIQEAEDLSEERRRPF